MLNHHQQRAIILTVTFWFTVIACPARADQAQIESKSKSLAHYIMAIIDDLNGENQKALSEYQKATKFNHREFLPHLRLGAYYIRQGYLDEAVGQLKIVVKLQPKSSQAHYLLALIYSSQKKYRLAADEYELILKIASKNNPDNFEIYAYLAQLYYALHKYSEAVDQLTQILQVQPKNISAIFLLGAVYSDLDQKEKAKESFQKVLSLEPDHDGALNSLAYMDAQEGINLDQALKMIRRAINLDPSNGAYYDTLGWVLFKLGFNAESLMALEKAQYYILDPIIYEHMGDVYKTVNEPALARKFWLKSLAFDPKQPKISEKIKELNKISARMEDINYNPVK